MWHLLDDFRCRHAIRVAERLADGWATKEEVREAASANHAAFLGTAVRDELSSDALTAYFATSFLLDADARFAAAHAAGLTAKIDCYKQNPGGGRRGPCEIIRDVFPP